MPEIWTSRCTPAARAASAIARAPSTWTALIALAAALEGNARGIDHGLAACDGDGHRFGHAEIGPHQGDLADIARGLERLGELDAPAGHADQIALRGERPNDRPADKAACRRKP